MGGKTKLAMIFVRPLSCISPLGSTLNENLIRIRQKTDAISFQENTGANSENWPQGKIADLPHYKHFSALLERILLEVGNELGGDFFRSRENKLIISTTKAELDLLPENCFSPVWELCHSLFGIRPIVLSNACISGVLAISEGERMIRSGTAQNVVVVGIDVLSDFVTFGFQSLFALSDTKCQPFSATRKGINLGEAAAAIHLSTDRVSDTIAHSGASANDANHISGPSRTGEGLFRSVTKSLNLAKLLPSDIDFISAHGTATLYNDDMESTAFSRLGLQNTPIHSMKSYFGHTLGAAGVIESVFCLSMLENQEKYASLNCENPGTVQQLNVQQNTEPSKLKRVLKTASGFGGGNASVIFERI